MPCSASGSGPWPSTPCFSRPTSPPATRQQALDWFRTHALEHPVRQGYLNRFHTGPRIPGTKQVSLPFPYLNKKAVAELDSLDCITSSSFITDRATDFPHQDKSADAVDFLKMLRRDFPHKVVFSKPWSARLGFHSPCIEIRWRGDEFDGVDPPPAP